MLHLSTCCCTCLNKENLKSVHIKDAEDIKIIDKLMFCITEKDSIYECAPLLICDKCYKSLDEMYNFKKNSLKKLELFKNCLKQLIRNPFFELTLNEPTVPQPAAVTQPEQPNIVKIEHESDEENSTVAEIELKDGIQPPEPSESSSSSQSTNFVIETIESLNNKKYENPVSKPLKTYSRVAKKSCQTCGRQFIRIDYYRNHISACSKNQLILATMRSNTVLPKRKKLFRRKPTDSDNDDDIPIKRKKRTKKLERTYCSSCKKSIAVRFLRRHHQVCPERNNS